MNTLLHFYPGDEFVALAFTTAVQISLIFLIAWLLVKLIGRGRAVSRHGIWLCALATISISPLATWVLWRAEISLVDLHDQTEALGLAGLRGLTASGESYEPLPPDGAVAAVAERSETAGPRSPRPTESRPLDRRLVSGPHDALRATATILTGIWVLGIGLRLIGFARGWYSVHSLHGRARPLSDPEIQAVLDEIQTELHMKRAVMGMISDDIACPVVTGLRRPCIILPRDVLDTFSRAALKQILWHEYAHVVRRDHWAGLLQRAAKVLFWPHPHVHRLCRELSRAREEACDDFALCHGEKHLYARTLLGLAQQARLAPAVEALALVDSRWRLEDRVSGLLDERRIPMLRINRLQLTSILAVLLAAAALAGGTKVLQESHEEAVAKIRALGGQVQIPQVIIPHDWKGGTEGLKHLEAIDGLTELWLSGVELDELHLAKIADLKQLIFNRSYFDEDQQKQVIVPLLAIKSMRLENLPSLEQLDLSNTTAEELDLAGLPKLTSLKLTQATANDQTLATLAATPNLESLEAGSRDHTGYSPQRTEITDAGLKPLADLKNLKKLDLTGARITDGGLQILAAVENLEELQLGGTSITDEGLKHLEDLQKLRILRLRGTQVSDSALANRKPLTNLTMLDIAGTKITAGGLVRAKAVPELSWLVVDSSQMNEDGSRMLRNCPKLRSLWLVGRGSAVATLHALPDRLTVLGLEGTQHLEISPGSLKKVKHLILSGVSEQVTAEILSHLGEAETVQTLEFRRGWLPSGEVDTTVQVHVTPEQLDQLKQAFPKATIRADLE